MNFVKLYIGDYLRDTGTLTLAQHGAYTLMLLEYYATEKPLPTGRDLHRLLRADSKQERDAIDFVAAKFWAGTESLTNPRADQEIARAAHQRAINQEVGRRGGRPKRTEDKTESVSESVSETEPNRNPNQTPDTREIQKANLLTQVPAFPPEKAAPHAPQLALVEPVKASLPDCPHLAVLALWAEVLPHLPQHNPSLWKGARSAHLRARWRETAAEKRWQSEADGLTYFRRLFGYVGQSQFLTGRTSTQGGRPPFVAELAWLVMPMNWAKTVEGKYHPEAAA